MRTRQLTDRALDYAVALVEGYTNLRADVLGVLVMDPPRVAYGPVELSGLDFIGGPAGDDIIDREMISTHAVGIVTWRASLQDEDGKVFFADGKTRREAAMRCYVASKLGDEVEIPPSLLM